MVCLNPELEDHDEYVYSVRKINVFDYNEKFFVLLAPLSSMKFKIALKVPNLKDRRELKGSATLALQGSEASLTVPIKANIDIPKLHCPKELYNTKFGCQVIRLAIKKGKKQDCKIPLKNCNSLGYSCEFEVTDINAKKGKMLPPSYDLVVYPSVANVPANGFILMNFVLKPALPGLRQTPSMKDSESGGSEIMKKILIMKVRNSSVVMSYPVCVELY